MASKQQQSGQQVYVTMLVMACVFLAVAIAFPTYEYISQEYWKAPPTVSTPSLEVDIEELLTETGIEESAEGTGSPAGTAESAPGTGE